MRTKIKENISPFACVSMMIFAIIGTLYVLSSFSHSIADRINSGVAQHFRHAMASIGNLFPFSLFEVFIYCLPIILVFVIYKAIKIFKSGEGRVRFLINLAAVVLLIFSGHLLALGIAHKTTPLAEKMGLSETKVTEEKLIEALTDLRDEINSLSGEVARNEEGVFTHGYSYTELSEKICTLYGSFAEQYSLPKNYNSVAKGVHSSWAMSYLGITGIYTYITGEANVNTYYPDYVTLYTAAHEMSHQRGILRENEANFVAYILLASSDDPSFRYSAALNLYGYFASALYKTNKDAYTEINSELSPLAKNDIRASNAVYDKYGDTVIEDISDWINDFYLESSGSEGIVSYSRVVELALAYRESKK